MQRILRINLLARNHALKNERKKNLKKLRDDWREYEFRKAAIEKIRNEYIRAERKHRREDWMAGPLAPKRDVGTRQEFYATVSSYLQAGPAVPPQARRGPKGNGWDSVGSEGLEGEHKEWEGVGNEGNIVEGDRVCIVRGNSSLIGQIGKVVDLNAEAKEVKVEGLNMADLEIPQGTDYRERVRFQSTELPIPLSDVRLVHRLTDEATGHDRDVIVKVLRGGSPYFQRQQNSPIPRHTRYIAGEDIEVPWPETTAPQYQAFEDDTTRYDVEQVTWTPTLYEPPIPETDIFSELRDDRFKRDREWHDDEYVRMKILEDARAQWYKDRKIQGPLSLLRERQLERTAQKFQQIKEAGLSAETERIILEEMMKGKGKSSATSSA